jgi:hypothetical protein
MRSRKVVNKMAKLYSGNATVTITFWDVEAESAYDAAYEAISEDLCEYSIVSVDADYEEDEDEDE